MPRKIWATIVVLVFALMSGLVLALPASANSPVNMYCNPEPVGSAGVEFDPTLVDPTQTTGWSAGVQYQGFNEAVTPFTPAGGYYEALWIDPSAPTYNTSSVTGTLYLNGQAVASNTLQHSSCGWSPPLPTQINLPPTPTLVDDASLQNDSHYVAPADTDKFDYTPVGNTVQVCIKDGFNEVFPGGNKCYTWPAPVDVYNPPSDDWTYGTWSKHGADNLPCLKGSHWVLPSRDAGPAQFRVDGGPWTPMTQNGKGSWAIDYSGAITATSVVEYRYQGTSAKAVFITLSHCNGDSSTPTPTPTETSSPTPSVTPSTPAATPSTSTTSAASSSTPVAARGVGGDTGVDEQAPAGSLGSVALFGLVLMSLIGLGAWRMRPKGAHC